MLIYRYFVVSLIGYSDDWNRLLSQLLSANRTTPVGDRKSVV